MSTAQPQVELIEKLGEGAMGAVWRARVDGIERAVKFTTAALDPESLERFEREADALVRLDPAPGVVRIFGRLREPRPGLVLELVEGGDLHSWLKMRGPDTETALAIARSIADALAHLHAAGVVHRDLKPANILLREPDAERPEPLLSDFGLARLTDLETLTRTGAMVGTPAYMAPEQALGRRVDARADVWAFGVILYELLSGRRAFDGSTPMSVMNAVLKGRLVPLGQLVPGLSPELLRLVDDCLAPDPERRPVDGAELSKRLDSAASGSSGPPATRSRWLVGPGLALICLTALGVAGARLLWTSSLQEAAVLGQVRRQRQLQEVLLPELEGRAGARLGRLFIEPLFRGPGSPGARDSAEQDDKAFAAALMRSLELIHGAPRSRRLPRQLESRRGALTWMATALELSPRSAEADGEIADSDRAPAISDLLATAARWRAELLDDSAAASLRELDFGSLAGDAWVTEALAPVRAFRLRFDAGRPPDELAQLASLTPEFCRRRLLVLVESRACVLALMANRPAANVAVHLEELERLARTEDERRDRARAWTSELARSLNAASPEDAVRAIIQAARHGTARDVAGVDAAALLGRDPGLAPKLDAACRRLCSFGRVVPKLGKGARLRLAVELAEALRDIGRPTVALRDMTFVDLEDAIEERLSELRVEGAAAFAHRLRLIDRLYALDAAPTIPYDELIRRPRGPDFGIQVGMRRDGLPAAVINLLSTAITDVPTMTRSLKSVALRLRSRSVSTPSSAELSLGCMYYFYVAGIGAFSLLPAEQRGDPGDLVELSRRVAASTDKHRFEALTRICQWSVRTSPPEDTIAIADILIEALPKRPAKGTSGFNVLNGIANLKRRWLVWEAKASALDRAGRRAEAVALLLRIQPADLRGNDYVDLLELLTELGGKDQAQRRGLVMIRSHPDTEESIRLGTWLLSIGDVELLGMLRETLVSRTEGNPDGNARRLPLLLALSELEAANDWLTRLLKEEVNTDYARIEMAACACRLGRFADARALVRVRFENAGFEDRRMKLLKAHPTLRGSK